VGSGQGNKLQCWQGSLMRHNLNDAGIMQSLWICRQLQQLLVVLLSAAAERGCIAGFPAAAAAAAAATCRSFEDVYSDPGSPLTRRTSKGKCSSSQCKSNWLCMQGSPAADAGAGITAMMCHQQQLPACANVELMHTTLPSLAARSCKPNLHCVPSAYLHHSTCHPTQFPFFTPFFPAGTYILAKVDGKRQLLMSGTGASPDGNRPFLDLFDLDKKEARRLWQSSPPYLESVGAIMSDFNHVSCASCVSICLVNLSWKELLTELIAVSAAQTCETIVG
jgi:hypothetical protein